MNNCIRNGAYGVFGDVGLNEYVCVLDLNERIRRAVPYAIEYAISGLFDGGNEWLSHL